HPLPCRSCEIDALSRDARLHLILHHCQPNDRTLRMQINDFQSLVKQKGQELYRDMPWRRDTRGYYILVSELMLQQTQVDRVIPKFEAFIAAFPDEQSLARANLADVLRLWQGLGYNRR